MALITNLAFGNIYTLPIVAAVVNYSQVGNMIYDGGGTWSSSTTWTPDKAFDSDTATFYWGGGTGNSWVGRDLLSAKTLNKAVILARQDTDYCTRINNTGIQISQDGSTWTDVGARVSGVTTSNYTTPVTINFTAVSARYIRLWWFDTNQFGNVAELKIFGQ